MLSALAMVMTASFLTACSAKVDVYTISADFQVTSLINSNSLDSATLTYKHSSEERFEYDSIKMDIFDGSTCTGDPVTVKDLISSNGDVNYTNSTSGVYSVNITYTAKGESITTDCLHSFFLGSPSISLTSPLAPISFEESNSYIEPLTGTCSPNGATISVNLGTLPSTICQNGQWSSNWDLSGESFGSYQAVFTATYDSVSTSLDIAAIKLQKTPSLSQSSLQLSSNTVATGSPVTITITVKDSSGDPISGTSVTLSATGTSNTLTQPSQPTDASGVTTASLSSTAPGLRTVSIVFPAELSSLSANVTIGDITAPSITGTVADGSFSNSQSTTTALSWTAGTDNIGLDHYQLAVGTTAGATDISSGWINIGLVTSITYDFGSNVFTSGSTYYPSIRAVDAQGNTSSVIQGNGWLLDTTAPDVTALSFNVPTETWFTNSVPAVSWSGANDAGSGISYYEIAVGTSVGSTDVKTWTSVGNISSSDLTSLSLNLNRGSLYYLSIRSVDSAGNVSSAFNSSTPLGVNSELVVPTGYVNSATKVDRRLIICGNFLGLGTHIGSAATISTATGNVSWASTSPKPRIDGSVSTIISDGSGGWFLGGSFSKVGNTEVSNLVHINSSGIVDTNFLPNPNGDVATLLLSSDKSTLYMGGSFTSIGGITRNYIASLNATNGSVNSGFNPNANGNVKAIVKDSSGNKLYLTGEFTQINGVSHNRLAAVNISDGSDVSSFTPSLDNSRGIDLLLSADNSKLYVGGNFTTVNGGNARKYLAQFNASDGTLITGFNAAVNGGQVISLLLSPDQNTLYVGGSFTTIGGTARTALASIDAGSGTNTGWNPNGSGIVSKILLSSDNSRIYVGGSFSVFGGETRTGITSVKTSDGSADSFFSNIAGPVSTLALSSGDSTLYAGGSFSAINISSRSYLAAVDTLSGQIDSGFNPNPDNVCTRVLLSYDDATLYVGGIFSSIGGQSRTKLAALNPTTGAATSFSADITGGSISALTLSPDDSTLYVGGSYTQIGGVARNNLAAVNTSSSVVSTSFVPQPNGSINKILLNSAGSRAFIGGNFTNIAGVARSYLSELNTSDGSAVSVFAPFLDSFPTDLLLSPNESQLYLVGVFSAVNSVARTNFARLNVADGSTDSLEYSFSPSIPWRLERSLDQQKIYIAGNFSSLDGNNRAGLAALNASDGSLSSFASKPMPAGGFVNAIFVDNTTGIFFAFPGSGNGTTAGSNAYLIPIDPISGNWLPGN